MREGQRCIISSIDKNRMFGAVFGFIRKNKLRKLFRPTFIYLFIYFIYMKDLVFNFKYLSIQFYLKKEIVLFIIYILKFDPYIEFVSLF